MKLMISKLHHNFTYICGKITEADGDESGFLAKFDDLGQRIWERTLIPINANQKRAIPQDGYQ